MPIPQNPGDRRGSRPGGRPDSAQAPQGERPPQGPPPTPSTSGPASDQAWSSLNARYSRVADKLALGSALKEIQDLTGTLEGLPSALADLRARGFRFGRGWEERIESLRERWSTQQFDARSVLNERVATLSSASIATQQAIQRLQRDASAQDAAQQQMSQLEKQVNQAERDIRGVYDQTRTEAMALNTEIRQAADLQEALDAASYQLYPDEHGFAMCKAKWLDGGQEPEGLLVLTDGRLILEQKEKKATKKVLFITTRSETVQKLLFASPIGAIDQVETTDKGGVLQGGKELLQLHFSRAPENTPSAVTLRLLGGARNETWAGLIRRVQSGQIAAELCEQAAAAAGAEPGTASAASAAPIPTQCPACGAALPIAVKGMRQLTCEFCGRSVSL